MSDKIDTVVYVKDDDNPGMEIFRYKPASSKSVDYVLSRTVDKHGGKSGDGRSEWMWVRLPNGDLLLATFPHGDTYFHVEDETGF